MKPPRPLCAFCKAPFEQTRKDRRTCSHGCATRLWRLDPAHADRQRELNQTAYWKAKQRRAN